MGKIVRLERRLWRGNLIGAVLARPALTRALQGFFGGMCQQLSATQIAGCYTRLRGQDGGATELNRLLNTLATFFRPARLRCQLQKSRARDTTNKSQKFHRQINFGRLWRSQAWTVLLRQCG